MVSPLYLHVSSSRLDGWPDFNMISPPEGAVSTVVRAGVGWLGRSGTVGGSATFVVAFGVNQTTSANRM